MADGVPTTLPTSVIDEARAERESSWLGTLAADLDQQIKQGTQAVSSVVSQGTRAASDALGQSPVVAAAWGGLSLPSLDDLTPDWVKPQPSSRSAPAGTTASSFGAGGQPSAMPTSSGGSSPSGLDDQQQAVYRTARESGLDDEGARVLLAVTQTEGGMGGAVGDNGNSFGLYQFHTQGQLPGFAAWAGVPVDQARTLANDPVMATRYAASTYLGDAIRRGREQGLSGADLATFVQREGQRSVAPERTGANYQRLFSQPTAETPAQAAPSDARGTPATLPQASAQGQYTPATLVPNQFTEGQQQGLTAEESAAVCGPAAAIAFARANGRNPTLREATELARASKLWSAQTGMYGPQAEVQLLDRLGVPASLEQGVDWNRVRALARQGVPTILSSSGHYWVVSGAYDDGTLEFGNSAGVLRASGGRTRFRPEELPGLGMGVPNATILLGGGSA